MATESTVEGEDEKVDVTVSFCIGTQRQYPTLSRISDVVFVGGIPRVLQCPSRCELLSNMAVNISISGFLHTEIECT